MDPPLRWPAVNIFEAVILGVVEGITEFLPVSSTGHLTITEELLGLKVNDEGVTAFTAIIQVGAIFAVLVYFWSDIMRIVGAFFRGLFSPTHREDFDYRFAWYVVAGSIPIGIVGFLGKDLVSGPLRSLWVVSIALIAWSGVMVFAERAATHQRHEHDMTLKDTIYVGIAQCIALVPGVSRSGATISIGLLRDFDRVTATRLSFFLSIPALSAAGIYEAAGEAGRHLEECWLDPNPGRDHREFHRGVCGDRVATKFVAKHSIAVFVWYRVGLGLLLAGLLAGGVIAAT